MTEGSSETRRLLFICDDDVVRRMVDGLLPDWSVTVVSNYLEGIGEAGTGSFDGVLGFVGMGQAHLADAVAGLREAFGDGRLVLCCYPEGEPVTRGALLCGADEYVICPLDGSELSEALGADVASVGHDGWGAGEAELRAMGSVVRELGSSPATFLSRLAELVRVSFDAESAAVVVRGTTATSGACEHEPVLREAIVSCGQSIGHVALGRCVHGVYGDDVSGRLVGYAGLLGELIEAAGSQRTYRELAYTDSLSGLPNRRYLMTFLERLLANVARDGGEVTLLMFDIDYFKKYNDAYGHKAGDEIIRGCGRLFRANCREHDVVTRFGGDEFAVVFWDKGGRRVEGSRHPSSVIPIIERFRRSLQAHQFEHVRLAEGAKLTISGGLATFPTDADSVVSLIDRADEALLRAKHDGKNCVFLCGENGSKALGREGAAGVG